MKVTREKSKESAALIARVSNTKEQDLAIIAISIF